MLGTMKPIDLRVHARLVAAQEALGDTNEVFAERFGVPVRTLQSWKYKERNLSKPALKLLEQIEKRIKGD
ncbi:MAG: hypothetical protein E6Q76_01110 [Rhizobium sp.]|nr:MAG: hypothetical protein E6Q76_01110 [Rhizobium sp.]